MNEDCKVTIIDCAYLPCCAPENKCGVCRPLWQRKLLVDDLYTVWLPVIGMTNDGLEKIRASKHGFLISNESGVWYIQEKLAFDLEMDEVERARLVKVCERVREAVKKRAQESEKNQSNL